MELSWTTFLLEIANFLILVWILKHFLYRPVLNVIARRQTGIEKKLADAETLHKDAEKLQAQYEGRLTTWEQEREKARETLAQELEAERTHKIAELQTELEQEREKARVVEKQRQQDARRKSEEIALANGARFASRLLQQAAGPELQTRLVELLIDELSQLTAERIKALRNSYGQTTASIVVSSAYPLPDEQRQRLEQLFASIIKTDTPLRYEEKPELIAGASISAGAWVFTANLQDELRGFAELHHDE